MGIVLGVSDLAPNDEVPSTFTEGSICVVDRHSLGVNHNGRLVDCCCLLQALSGTGTRRLGSAVDFVRSPGSCRLSEIVPVQ